MQNQDFRIIECKLHSGIRAEVDELHSSDKDQWDKINTLQTSKASSSQMKWVIGIFLVIALATVGFLWTAQVTSTDTIIKKIEVMDDKSNTKREETNSRLDALKGQVNELKWGLDEHQRKTDKR